MEISSERFKTIESLAKAFLIEKNIITVGNTTTGSEVDLSNVLALFVEKMQKPQPMHNLMKIFKTAEGILVVKPPKDIDFDKLVELIKSISKKPTFVQENESGLGLHGMPFNVEFSKDYPWQEPVIMTDFKEYMRDCTDPSFTFEDWKDMMDKYNQVTKEILDEVIEPFTWIDKDGFDVLTGKKKIIIGVEPGKHCRQESYILREYAKNGGVIIGVHSDLIASSKELEDLEDFAVLKGRSVGMTNVESFLIHNIHMEDFKPEISQFVEKPWDTKKQKRNNYKKKRRK